MNYVWESAHFNEVRRNKPMLDTQRAGMWKRMSAALFDVIILFTVIVGMALLLSAVLDYDQHIARMDQLEAEYAEKYGIDFDITAEELKALSEEELKIYEEADKA